MPRSTSASTARSAGRATFLWLAATPVAPMKHADQPAANSCSGLVPPPAVPGDDSLTSRRPSELREAPSRPPLVWVFAVYNTFSSWVMADAPFEWLCGCCRLHLKRITEGAIGSYTRLSVFFPEEVVGKAALRAG